MSPPAPNPGWTMGLGAATSAPSAPNPAGDEYAARRAELQAIAGRMNAQSGRISGLRGVTFLVAAGLAGYGLFRPLPLAGWVIAGLIGAAFIALVVAHALLITKEAGVLQRVALVDRAIARLSGELPARPGELPAPTDHGYAGDLDIFGPTSLFRLLDATATNPGQAALASWLSAPAAAPVIVARQQAVQEIALKGRFREDLAILGAATGGPQRKVDPLVEWAEQPSDLGAMAAPSGDRDKRPAKAPPASHPLLIRAAFMLVPLTLLLLILGQVLGPEQLGPWHRLWMLPLLLQIAVLGALRPVLEPILVAAASKQAPFGRFRGVFRRIEEEPFSSPLLGDLRRAIGGESASEASGAMNALERVIGYAELRHNGLVHFFANLFLLWDVWCAMALLRWRARFGRRVRGWFNALGQLEALASLGTFAREHPDYAFPEVRDGAPAFEAQGLGHPLLPAATRVVNDVAFPEPGSALLVTGSNMSGKSTLLRAIGVNAVLAQAGAPVCAKRLVMSTLSIRTSMRITDSLAEGVSHFYAELTKIKQIVDAANAGEKVLFLLDEILHGTNSRERHIGAIAIVVHLIDRGAIGAVSSHDLGLSVLEKESGGRVRNVHFEELVADGRMTFDYILKPGVVKTANALRLMKLVGIDVHLGVE